MPVSHCGHCRFSFPRHGAWPWWEVAGVGGSRGGRRLCLLLFSQLRLEKPVQTSSRCVVGCAVDCRLSAWSAWSQCSHTCGAGGESPPAPLPPSPPLSNAARRGPPSPGWAQADPERGYGAQGAPRATPKPSEVIWDAVEILRCWVF